MTTFEKDRLSEGIKSSVSRITKKTLTASELKEYFKQNEEEIRSKYSEISKQSLKSNFKTRLMKKIDRERNNTSGIDNDLREEANHNLG